MTALQIMNGLKNNKFNMLWLNAQRREASFYKVKESCSEQVEYDDAAMIVKLMDAELILVDDKDGLTYSSF